MAFTKETILACLVFVVIVWAGMFGLDMHKEIRTRQLQAENYPQYQDFLSAMSICFGMLVAQLLFRPLFAVVARAMIPKKARWSYAVWGLKVTRCCDSVFKCSYYVTMMAWLFALLQGASWVPWVLGGTGSTRFCWTDNFPFQAISSEMRRFYLTALGYHLSEVLMLMIEAMRTRHPDFWEMLLHHTVSITLVSYSYLLNYVRIGSLMLFSHGLTDIFVYASKAFVDTGNLRAITVTYLGLIFSYAWCRIFVFPVFIMRSAWLESLQEVNAERTGWSCLNFALCVLLLLHMYWFGLIIRIGFVWRKTGQPRDLQSKLSYLDVQEKKGM
jgi:ceramide synthetase